MLESDLRPEADQTPPGFVRCVVCGEYNGETLGRYLNREGSFVAPGDDGRTYGVTCLCEGTVCRRCGVHKIHRTGSNGYDPETNRVWHYPWFYGTFPCSYCRSNEGDGP